MNGRAAVEGGHHEMESAPMSYQPCAELQNIMLAAMSPCTNFAGACRDLCTWAPERGHIPRGFGGATGALEDVKLIIVTAEPGDPASDEKYEGTPEENVRKHAAMVERFLEQDDLRRNGKAAPFHRNLRRILDLCWPNMELRDQLRMTWLTETVLCSASISGGSIKRSVEDACISSYLAKQIEAMPGAFVLALGGKASGRMRRNSVRFHASAQHPSARPATLPEPTWQAAATAFRQWLAGEAPLTRTLS